MKEQDAAHSFEKEEDDIRGHHEPDDRPQSMIDLAEKIKLEEQLKLSELTRLRSELQQKDEEIVRLKNDLADALDVKNGNGPTALSMLTSELQQERELRKELVECIESYIDLELFANPKPIETLIKKAKLKN